MTATLLDAYAVIAVLRGEQAAVEVTPLLDDGQTVAIHPLNLAEVIDRLARSTAAEPDEIETDVSLLGITLTDASDKPLIQAGRLHASAYHRTRCPVSLADCVAAAQALTSKMALATSDPHLYRLVKRHGGEVIALSDSMGSRPDDDDDDDDDQ